MPAHATKTSYIHPVPTSFSEQKVSIKVLKKRWDKAETRLKTAFPGVHQALWAELGQAATKEKHDFTPENDPYIHAYLLSQEFSLVVQKIISEEMGSIPLHARCGCSDCVHNPGLKVGIILSGVDEENHPALEADYLKHAEQEIAKFKAVGLL